MQSLRNSRRAIISLYGIALGIGGATFAFAATWPASPQPQVTTNTVTVTREVQITSIERQQHYPTVLKGYEIANRQSVVINTYYPAVSPTTLGFVIHVGHLVPEQRYQLTLTACTRTVNQHSTTWFYLVGFDKQEVELNVSC